MINCKKCGAVIPDNLKTCLICGAKAGDVPSRAQLAFIAGDAVPDAAPIARQAAGKHHPKLLTRILVMTGLFLILAAIATFASQLIPYYFGAPGVSRAKNAIIYTADGNLKFMSPAMTAPEILVENLGRFGGTTAQASPNGKYIAYLHRSGGATKLYLRDFSARPSVTQPEIADSEIHPDVQSFFFTENNAYLIYLTRDGQLYSYDFAQSRLIEEHVREIIDHDDERVLCMSENTADAHAATLHVRGYLPNNNHKQIVAEDVSALIDYSPAFDKFIFTVWQSDSDNGTVSDIIAVDLKQHTRQTLATGAGSIIEADAKSFTVLYQTAYRNPLHYDNVINDDRAREDSKVKEPDLDDYPLLKEFYEKNGVDADYQGSMEFEDIAEEDAKLDRAIAVYDKAMENEKLRQKMLDGLDMFIAEFPTLYDLYLYQNGNIKRISESSYSPFNNAQLDVANGVAAWRETNFNDLEKLVFSRLPANTDIFTLLSEKLTDKLYLQAFGQNAVAIGAGEKGETYRYGSWQLTGKADGMFFTMLAGTPSVSERNRDEAFGDLFHDFNLYYYYAGTNKDIYGHIFAMDSGVGATGGMLDGDRLLYFKNISGGIGDLYLLDGTKTDSTSQRIGENVPLSEDYLKILNNGKTLLFCERFNEKTNSGNLFMYTNQNRQLATDVTDVYYKSDSLVYFTRNRQDDQTGLYLFGENGPVLLDSGVTAVAAGSFPARYRQ